VATYQTAQIPRLFQSLAGTTDVSY